MEEMVISGVKALMPLLRVFPTKLALIGSNRGSLSIWAGTWLDRRLLCYSVTLLKR